MQSLVHEQSQAAVELEAVTDATPSNMTTRRR
jgi:hypothetical protein